MLQWFLQYTTDGPEFYPPLPSQFDLWLWSQVCIHCIPQFPRTQRVFVCLSKNHWGLCQDMTKTLNVSVICRGAESPPPSLRKWHWMFPVHWLEQLSLWGLNGPPQPTRVKCSLTVFYKTIGLVQLGEKVELWCRSVNRALSTVSDDI